MVWRDLRESHAKTVASDGLCRHNFRRGSLWGQGDDPAAAIRYKYIYNFASDPHIDFEVENYMINLVTKKTIMRREFTCMVLLANL